VEAHFSFLTKEFTRRGDECIGLEYKRILLNWLGDHNGLSHLCSCRGEDFSAHAFHAACNGKERTFTIVAVAGGIFGGYTPIAWQDRPGWVKDPSGQSFIFCLKKGHGNPPYRLALGAGDWVVINHQAEQGPGFANAFCIEADGRCRVCDPHNGVWPGMTDNLYHGGSGLISVVTLEVWMVS
jgi:hypothetical protein